MDGRAVARKALSLRVRIWSVPGGSSEAQGEPIDRQPSTTHGTSLKISAWVSDMPGI